MPAFVCGQSSAGEGLLVCFCILSFVLLVGQGENSGKGASWLVK